MSERCYDYRHPLATASEIVQVSDMLPIQCKMARTAIGWGVRELAAAAKTSPDTVSRFERGEPLRERTLDSMRSALEAAGVQFIPENGGGAGVRLRKIISERE